MTGRVEGRVALITGAARGLGRAAALRLAAEGADVVAVDVCGPLPGVDYASATPDDLAETVAGVEAAGRRAVSARVDVRDLDELRIAVDDAVGRLGRLDVVVANAGICIPRSWHRVTPEIFRDTLEVNVTGVWNTIMAGAPHLVAAGSGSVIVTSSAAGLKVQPYMVPYTASKWAVRGMAKAFAAELAQHQVRVNSVHPTGMTTGMAGEAMQAALGEAMAENPRPRGMFTNMLPVDFTAPEDVAGAVLFLAGDEASYITGATLMVDGGWMAG